ncbi:MAG: glycoside hydrolase family 3 N-terminal domain-containing protein [Chitinophagaceae bacterium]
MFKFLPLIVSCLLFFSTRAQIHSPLEKKAWVDSVFHSLSKKEKISQLIVVRLSTVDAKTGYRFLESKVDSAVKLFKVGGICLFQGGPVRQAGFVNYFQSISKTPLLISIDAETGIGMRVDSVRPLPRQMMLGAVQNPALIYEYGQWVGDQCKRMGIHMNYAPDVDINNNPENPVINDRSFGENKERVSLLAIEYMKGMQNKGILTCAKHFPGHGDVSVDSHQDLPLINKSKKQLDELELYPFKKLIEAGVDAVMVGHLSVPAIDTTKNRASSISYQHITSLLKNELGFKGMVVTDALEMKGVTKYFPGGTISREAIIAGNDMLCLPEDIPATIREIRKAIKKKKLHWSDINQKVRLVLEKKFDVGLADFKPIDTTNIVNDLNAHSPYLRRRIAEAAITLVKYEDQASFPIQEGQYNRIAYVAFGINADNLFANRMRKDYNADVFYFDYKKDSAYASYLLQLLEKNYDRVVIGIHQIRRFPAGNFGMSDLSLQLIRKIKGMLPNTIFVFGNPYVIKNFCDAKNIIACYEDDPINQEVAADMFNGHLFPKGKLPVSICKELPAGTGISVDLLPVAEKIPGININALNVIDSLANDAIRQHATPGIVVLVAKDGKIAYHKAFGYLTYDSLSPNNVETIYDMASVTKICATSISVMKLYDQGKLDINATLGTYIPWVRGSDKENLLIRDVLLHQARLKSFIPFYRELIDSAGFANKNYFQNTPSANAPYRVADSMYMVVNWRDSIYQRIRNSVLEKPGTYIYSDNDFIFLGLIVEAISGMPLNDFVRKNFYEPMGLTSIGFLPRQKFPLTRIAPTENEKYFRRQLIQGDVHDPGAAMLGGVAGHAGLFSNAYDLAVVMQMLLNKGKLNGKKFISDTTVMKFTNYNSDISRRGLGFDKPEKDNMTRKEPYPTLSASPMTFGHTGFTGICTWADPIYNLLYVFLSNRVHPDGSNKLLNMNVRSNIHEAIYKALEK